MAAGPPDNVDTTATLDHPAHETTAGLAVLHSLGLEALLLNAPVPPLAFELASKMQHALLGEVAHERQPAPMPPSEFESAHCMQPAPTASLHYLHSSPMMPVPSSRPMHAPSVMT